MIFKLGEHMTLTHARTFEYVIEVSRERGRVTASIPELCIRETKATPQEAMLAILDAEKEAIHNLQIRGVTLPPARDDVSIKSVFERLVSNFLPFFTKLAIGYFVVLCMTIILFAVALPSVRSQTEQYLRNKDISTDVRKVFSRFGIEVCSTSR